MTLETEAARPPQADRKGSALHFWGRRLAHHVFGEPEPAVGIDVDADAHLMEGRAEQVDAVPAAERLVGHAFLNRGYTGPGCRIWPGQTDVLPAIASTSKAFVGDTLIWGTTIRAGMTEAAMGHVPAMQQGTGGQGRVPGKGGQATGGAVGVD